MPQNKGYKRYNSAIIQPKAKISTGELYFYDFNNISGARYHLVETYSVKGGLDRISLARPKSQILTSPLLIRRF